MLTVIKSWLELAQISCRLLHAVIFCDPYGDDRVALLGGIDKLRSEVDRFGAMASIDEFNRKALDLLTSNKCRDAFDINTESPEILVSGGGLKTGVVVGSTNSKAEHPKDRPLEPNDLWATMFQHLGIDTDHSFPDHQGRPMPILTTGAPISELV